jgi:hypothetical protein
MRKFTSAAVVTVAALATVLIAAACSSGGGYGTLIGAAYPACASQGRALAGYLETGNPQTDDLNFGDERQRALSLSGQQRALFIRQTADQAIAVCDSSEAAAIQNEQAQAAQASAAASAAAAQSAAATYLQQQVDAITPQCNEIGGQVNTYGSTVECDDVSYYGTDGQQYEDQLGTNGLTLAGDSSDGAGTSATPSECAQGYYPDGSAGPVNGTPGHYAYGLCLVTWNS